jgi:regulatory protein
MPVVTAIKQQAKRPDRYSIFVDGSYRFSLSTEQLTDSGLATGQDLSASELDNLDHSSKAGKALAAAYVLLSYRARSRQELVDRLARKGYDEATIETVLNRLSQSKLVDDGEFVRQWVAKPASKHRSLRRLDNELLSKGISSTELQAVMSELGTDHDRQAITVIIQKRLDKGVVDKQKLLGYLSRQGFQVSLILQVLKEDFSETDLR